MVEHFPHFFHNLLSFKLHPHFSQNLPQWNWISNHIWTLWHWEAIYSTNDCDHMQYIAPSQLISLSVSLVLPWQPRRTWPPKGGCWNPYKAGSTRWPVSFMLHMCMFLCGRCTQNRRKHTADMKLKGSDMKSLLVLQISMLTMLFCD